MQDDFDKRIFVVLPLCLVILFALIFLGMNGGKVNSPYMRKSNVNTTIQAVDPVESFSEIAKATIE